MCIYSWFASGISDSGFASLLTIGSFSCFFVYLRIFYWLLDILFEQLRLKYILFMPGNGHASSVTVLSQSSQKLSWGLVLLLLWLPPPASDFCTVTLCLGWGLGCWKVFFSQCCCSVLSFQPCLCSCASEGGHSPYSCSSPSRRLLLLITQCLSGWWWVQKGFCVFQVQPLS